MSADQETLVEDLSRAGGSSGAGGAHRRLSLRVNSSWMLAGNAFYAGCQWVMLMVLAKLGTPAMVGQFVLALAVTTPVMAFFMFQLRTVQATDARRDYTFGDYLALRLATSGLAILTVCGICLAFGYVSATGLVILAAVISAAVDSVSDIVYGLLQQHERLDRMAQSLILKGLLSLTLLSAAIFVTGQVVFGVLGIAVSRLLILSLWDLRNARFVLGEEAVRGRDRLRPHWDGGKLFGLARLSFPLGLVMMLIVLSSSIPRYFVEHTLGEHSLGIFGALAYLGMVGTTAVGAFGESATPRLAQYYSSGERGAFAWLLLRLAGIGAVLGVAGVTVAWLAGPMVLGLLYRPEYAEHASLLVWMMLAAGITYVASFTGYAVTAARYFRIQMPLFAAVALVTTAACYWLVPAYGMFGAAMAMCATAVAQLVGRCLILWHALGSKPASGAEPLAATGRRYTTLMNDIELESEPSLEA